MEFWGVEVKSGKPLKVTPEEDTLIHISQATLGDCKSKKGESVPLYVKVGNQKLVLGTLLAEVIPQISFDLVFEKEFELSHNWGKGSVYFVGYKSPNIEDQEGGEYFSDSEEEEEEVPATIAANVNAKAITKPKATPAEVKKNAKPESADDDEEDESDSEEGEVDEDDSEEEDEEETPKKPESSKKRANEAAPKTPVSAKKAKPAVTLKTEEKKKVGHTATPHPAKKGAKTPTAATTQSPKSANQVSCGSCKKTFNSSNALESHNKAKHAAAK